MSGQTTVTNKSIITRDHIIALSTGGVCIALAYVLSLIKVYQMPQGGSVTPASMLPIILFALCFGFKKGIVVAFLFSLLQLINGYFFMPVQVIMDYILAYSCLGLAGLFSTAGKAQDKNLGLLDRMAMISFPRMCIGAIIAISGRLVFSVLSGVIFFAEYAPAGQNPWLYSLIYNGSYLFPELVITVVLLTLMVGVLGLHKKKSTV